MALDITKISKDDAVQILGVQETASQDEIKQAYKKLAAACHPDKTGSTYVFQLVNNAYQALTKTPAKTANPAKTAKTEKPARKTRPVTELVQDKEFLCPFSTFMAATEFGIWGMEFKNQHVQLTRDFIRKNFVKTIWPAKACVKTYKNWLMYILNRPCETVEKNVQIPNRRPSSYYFEQVLNIKLSNTKVKYYRITVDMDQFNIQLTDKDRIRNAAGTHPNTMECKVPALSHTIIRCGIRFTQF